MAGVAAIGQSGQRGSRAARRLWSESGGRGGVSDLGGGEQPTAEASAASTSRSPSAREGGRGMSPFALAGPAMPDGTSRLKDTLGLTPERVSGVPSRGLEMCLVQAGSAPVARSQESRWSSGSTR